MIGIFINYIDPLLPPNPDRSFAAVTSHEGFPKPEHDVSPPSEEPSLSSLPDVKDMLEKPSGKCKVLDEAIN